MPYGQRPSFLQHPSFGMVYSLQLARCSAFTVVSCNQEEMCELLVQQRPLDQRLSGLQADNAGMRKPAFLTLTHGTLERVLQQVVLAPGTSTRDKGILRKGQIKNPCRLLPLTRAQLRHIAL